MRTLKICIILSLLLFLYLSSSVLVSNILLHDSANGSFIKLNDKTIGLKHIGQQFSSNKYFHNRASAINYQNNISGNSNFSFYSKRGELLVQLNHSKLNYKIKDLNIVTESASGLDPHITLNGTLAQVERVARARNLSTEKVNALVGATAKPRIFGLLGDKIINVLELNIKLDEINAR